MEIYYLNGWKIIVENKSNRAYDFVCDEKNFVIIDELQNCVSFIEVNKKGNLVLQKLYYCFQCKIDNTEKRLFITVTN